MSALNDLTLPPSQWSTIRSTLPESKIQTSKQSATDSVLSCKPDTKKSGRTSRLLCPLPGSFARHSSFSSTSSSALLSSNPSSSVTTTATTTAINTPSTTASGDSQVKSQGDVRTLPLIFTSFKTSPITPPIEGKNVHWDTASKPKIVDRYTTSPEPLTPKSPCMDDSTHKSQASSRLRDETPESMQGSPLASESSPGVEETECVNVDGHNALLNGVSLAVSQLNVKTINCPTLHILSQTLPCPGPADKPSANPPAALPHVLSKICSAATEGQCPYVTITHAMPPKASLSSLPTSPPTTPHFGNDCDYFNFKVFSSATPAPGYDSTNSHTSLPKNPVVPPKSVHTAVIERYIPPSSEHEYDNIFSAGNRSVLVDRFQELSSDNGTLTLIYPTKKGVNTFKRDHLGPILDPVIRRLIVTKNISSDVAAHLQSMPPVKRMGDFDEMRTKIHQICDGVNENTSQSPLEGDRLSVVYSATETIHINRSVWVDWYLYQGASRAKATLSHYMNMRNRSAAHKGPGSSARAQQAKVDINSAMIYQEISEGLHAPNGPEPDSGIELAIFVIKRSRQGRTTTKP